MNGPLSQADALLKSLDQELVSLKRQVQNNKQMLSLQKHKMVAGIDDVNLRRQTQESMPGGQMKNFFWLFKVCVNMAKIFKPYQK